MISEALATLPVWGRLHTHALSKRLLTLKIKCVEVSDLIVKCKKIPKTCSILMIVIFVKYGITLFLNNKIPCRTRNG